MKPARYAIHEHRVVGEVLISFATDGRMSDESMNAMLNDMRTKPIKKFLGTDIGGVEVTSVQRAAGAELVREKGISVVVVTDERIMRGVVTALSWLGANIKSYSWTTLEDAVRHLGVNSSQEREIVDTVLAMRRSCEAKAKARAQS